MGIRISVKNTKLPTFPGLGLSPVTVSMRNSKAVAQINRALRAEVWRVATPILIKKWSLLKKHIEVLLSKWCTQEYTCPKTMRSATSEEVPSQTSRKGVSMWKVCNWNFVESRSSWSWLFIFIKMLKVQPQATKTLITAPIPEKMNSIDLPKALKKRWI